MPVPAGTAAVARALGFQTVPDRGRFVSELTRLVHDIPARWNVPVASVLLSLRQQPASDMVPLPLTAEWWSDAVFHRPIAPDDLLFAILGEPRAALVCHALSALDDETLDYFANHPAVLTPIFEREAAAFGAFGANLVIHGDRVVPPGGEIAVPLWEAVVGEPVMQPERFLPALFAHEDGRTAYLYDFVALLDAPQAAFALGLWRESAAARVEAMKSLASAWSGAFQDWRVRTQPFARQLYDPAVLLRRVKAGDTGAPAAPSARGFWLHVFESPELSGDPAKLLAVSPDYSPVDAAWLVENLQNGDGRLRADRLDQFAFGQRVFASASPVDLPNVLVALRAFPRFRMLLLTLERMGVTSPAIYAAAARQASRLSQPDPSRAFNATGGFQGALALLHRMTVVGTLDRRRAESLVASLVSVPLNERGEHAWALARWLDVNLRAVLPSADSLEAALVSAMAGPSAGDGAPLIQWEGQNYRFDPPASERRRLERAREKQETPPIDVVLDFQRTAQVLAAPSFTLGQADSVVARLNDLVAALPPPGGDADLESVAPGVAPLRAVRAVVAKAIDGIERGVAARDVKRTARAGAVLLEAADNLFAQTLVSLVYAVSLGDPDGSAFLADRDRLKQAISRLVGEKHGDLFGAHHNISPSEAIAISRGDQSTYDYVVNRECVIVPRQRQGICRSEIETEAADRVQEGARGSADSVRALHNLLTGLKAIEGPKTLLVVSEGFYTDDAAALVSDLGDLAAASRTTLYALQLASLGDASDNRSAASVAADQRDQRSGL